MLVNTQYSFNNGAFAMGQAWLWWQREVEGGCWWLTPVILATQEAEIRRIVIQSHPGEIVHETLSRKNPSQKNGAGGVAQGVDPEFKPQYWKKKLLMPHIQYSLSHNAVVCMVRNSLEYFLFTSYKRIPSILPTTL
jgi:hypothetical protein